MGRRKKNDEQLHIEDMKLNIGDKIYKDGQLYAEVVAVSSSLYFLQKNNSSIPDPHGKESLINLILSGKFTIENITF